MQRLPPARPSAEELAFRKREGSTPPNLSLALAHAPDVARIFLELTRAVPAGMTLRQKELIILLTGRLTNNEYCWGHHVPPALEGGLSVEQIRGILDGDYSLLPPEEQTLLECCAAMIERRLTDDLWNRMSRGRTPEELVKITMTVGFYCMLGTVQATVNVPQDEGFGGWEQP